jgi:hypothetical protein
MMGDLDAQELAQLGLKHIQDAVVGLLSRHAGGLTKAAISERLGLAENLPVRQRTMIATAVLALLLESGRILWDGQSRVYRDNPDMI